MSTRWLSVATFATFALAYAVIVLGAYVRLSDAGLGCPDWPGCYGRLIAPSDPEQALSAGFERPLDSGKAWKEMVHRYAASLLGLSIMGLAFAHWREARAWARRTPWIAHALVPLVVFQGLLGMWTVTLLLKPLVVTLHLLGGFATVALLWWLCLRRFTPAAVVAPPRAARRLVIGALAVVIVQVALGGWTSANYAALACTDFPKCQSSWWPQMDFPEAFTLWRGLGIDYEFGVLDGPARTAVHFTHRLGALFTVIVALLAAAAALATREPRRMLCAGCILAAVSVQVLLGVGNVRYGLPMPIAVAHHAVAALLLLSVVSLLFHSPADRTR